MRCYFIVGDENSLRREETCCFFQELRAVESIDQDLAEGLRSMGVGLLVEDVLRGLEAEVVIEGVEDVLVVVFSAGLQ